jgi:hypothetical protein
MKIVARSERVDGNPVTTTGLALQNHIIYDTPNASGFVHLGTDGCVYSYEGLVVTVLLRR